MAGNLLFLRRPTSKFRVCMRSVILKSLLEICTIAFTKILSPSAWCRTSLKAYSPSCINQVSKARLHKRMFAQRRQDHHPARRCALHKKYCRIIRNSNRFAQRCFLATHAFQPGSRCHGADRRWVRTDLSRKGLGWPGPAGVASTLGAAAQRGCCANAPKVVWIWRAHKVV